MKQTPIRPTNTAQNQSVVRVRIESTTPKLVGKGNITDDETEINIISYNSIE